VIVCVVQHQDAGLGRDEELFVVFVDFHSGAGEVFCVWEVALLHWLFGLRRFETSCTKQRGAACQQDGYCNSAFVFRAGNIARSALCDCL